MKSLEVKPIIYGYECDSSLQHEILYPDERKIVRHSWDDDLLQKFMASQHFSCSTSSEEIINCLVLLGQAWLDRKFSWRRMAEEWLPYSTGFSSEMITETLNITFREFTHSKLLKCIPNNKTDKNYTTLHIQAGNIYHSSLFGIIYGLLSGQPQFVKSSSQEPLFFWLFAKSIIDVCPKIRGMISITYWKGGDLDLENKMLRIFHRIVAYGSNQSIKSLQTRIDKQSLFYGFGHKISCIVVPQNITELLSYCPSIAQDIALYDQHGCMSPQFILYPRNSEVSVNVFADRLSECLDECQNLLPRGNISLDESLSIMHQRDLITLKRIKDDSVYMKVSHNSSLWTVTVNPDANPHISPLNRYISIFLYSDVEELELKLNSFMGYYQVVGVPNITALENDYKVLFNNLGVCRICETGLMQKPFIEEKHKGKLNPESFEEEIKMVPRDGIEPPTR